jgi:hypothetical protein
MGKPLSVYATISKVDKTLATLLWNNIKNDVKLNSIISAENQISLSSPTIFDTDNSKKLSLFLYNITEFSPMRNSPFEGSNKMSSQPLYLTLYYLVTPCTQNFEIDHLLLGKIFQIFTSNHLFQANIPHDNQANDAFNQRIMFDSLSIDDLNKIWSILGTKYKLSASYSVSPVLIN